MPPGIPRRRGRGFSALAALLACGALLPASATAAADRAGEELSPRLAELARPPLRTAPPAEQAARLALPSTGPGSLLRDGNRVLAYVRFDHGAAAAAEELRAAGARLVDVNPRYQTVTLAVRPADLRRVAAVPRVDTVTEALAPIVAATGCAGLVTSEGDAQLRAGLARESFNLDGAGVTVGILSDSYDTDAGAATHAAGDIASGDLPGPGNPCGRTSPVNLIEELFAFDVIDEGRAMAQIVHDLAPGASLAFATAFNGQFGFAQNIRRLAAPPGPVPGEGGAGAQVIVDDILYLDDPFFQEGPIGVAVGDVAADGVTYFSAAGNDNLLDAEGNDIASWEAPEFRDATACPPKLVAVAETEKCMDFNPDEAEEDPTFEITVEPEDVLIVDLQWAEPWNGVATDIDVFLLDEKEKPIPAGGILPVVGSYSDNVGGEGSEGTQQPFEAFGWENETNEPQDVNLVINRCFTTEEQKENEELGCNPNASETTKPPLKFVLVQNGGGVSATEYPQSEGGDTVGPTIFGHSGSPNAVSVGAVPFNDDTEPEEYSSRGPVTLRFGPASSATPAEPLPEPQVITKPDLAATDCGLTTFFFPTMIPGLFRFCGTSAAAPHGAAVSALMRQANPALSVQQIRTALATSARPVGGFGANAVGAGLVDAVGAVERVALPPQVTITDRPAPLSRNPRPSIGFTASRPVRFACSIDGGAPQPCGSPFIPPTPLPDGDHGFVVSGTDAAGRSGTSEHVSFRIDTRRPRAFFRRKPRKTIRIRKRRVKAVFRFGSNEKKVRFTCRVDRGLFRVCKPKLVRRYRVGRHVVKVKAQDEAGNVSRRPAVYRFRVKRRGRATRRGMATRRGRATRRTVSSRHQR
ncbi:MAG TPA: S8 family serine peptidase [Solirubrobacterales bacterium]